MQGNINKPTPEAIGKSLFLFIGFSVFVVMFASLGNEESFRTTNLKASVGDYSSLIIKDKQNQEFLDTYMPYFYDFSLKYTKELQDLDSKKKSFFKW